MQKTLSSVTRRPVRNRTWARLLPAALSGLLAPQLCHGAAFSIYEQSPAGTALSGAMTARPDDASAIFYNPAGLGFLPGLSVLAGATVLTAQASATTSAGQSYDAQRGVFFLPTLYAAARVHDRVSLGVGGFASHGLSVDWKNDSGTPFPGRFAVQRAGLQTFTLNPTVAVRIMPMVSLAVGLDVVFGSVELSRSLALGQDEAKIDLAAGATAVGANAGVLMRLVEGRLSAGLSYRSIINLDLQNGKIGYTPAPGVAGGFPYTKGGAHIALPHTLAIGIAGRPVYPLIFSLDINTALWSSTKDLTLTLQNDAETLSQVSVTQRKWRDAVAVRLGVEGDLSRVVSGRLVPKVRGGLAYDQSPVPDETLDPSLPDGDRLLASLGLSLGLRGVGSLDLAYMAVVMQGRTSQNPDLPLSYRSGAHVFSAGLVVQLDNVIGRRSADYKGTILSE